MRTPPQPNAPVVAIVTADRAPSCGRALEFVLHETREEKKKGQPILVVDNSRSPAGFLETVQVCRSVAIRHQRAVLVVGRRTAARLVQAINGVDVTAGAAASFGLRTRSSATSDVGAARNLVHLLTLDRHTLSIDDDVTGPVLEPPGADTAPTFGPWVRMRALAAVDVGQWVPVGLLGAHSRWLGAKLAGGEDRHRVTVTMSGLRGDCGASGPWFEFWANDPAHTTLTRRVVRGAPQPALVSARTGLMTYAYGVVNDGSLPPFFPIGRCQDGAFGSVLHWLRPNALLAHVPAYVLHEPPVKRMEHQYRSVTRALTAPLTTNEIIETLVDEYPAQIPEAARAPYLVDRIEDLAGAVERGELAELERLRLCLQMRRMNLVSRWANDKSRILRWRVRRSIQKELTASPGCSLPVEWGPRDHRQLADYLRSAASMVAHWYEVTAAVRALPLWRSPWAELGGSDGVVHAGA